MSKNGKINKNKYAKITPKIPSKATNKTIEWRNNPDISAIVIIIFSRILDTLLIAKTIKPNKAVLISDENIAVRGRSETISVIEFVGSIDLIPTIMAYWPSHVNISRKINYLVKLKIFDFIVVTS